MVERRATRVGCPCRCSIPSLRTHRWCTTGIQRRLLFIALSYLSVGKKRRRPRPAAAARRLRRGPPPPPPAAAPARGATCYQDLSPVFSVRPRLRPPLSLLSHALGRPLLVAVQARKLKRLTGSLVAYIEPRKRACPSRLGRWPRVAACAQRVPAASKERWDHIGLAAPPPPLHARPLARPPRARHAGLPALHGLGPPELSVGALLCPPRPPARRPCFSALSPATLAARLTHTPKHPRASRRESSGAACGSPTCPGLPSVRFRPSPLSFARRSFRCAPPVARAPWRRGWAMGRLGRVLSGPFRNAFLTQINLTPPAEDGEVG